MTHSQLVRALAKSGADILAGQTPAQAHLLHMGVGVCGEAGELIDAIKKHVVYRKPLDIPNIVEELGDLEFYLEGIRQALGLDRDVILTRNIEKLTLRYGARYSDAAAVKRKDKAV